MTAPADATPLVWVVDDDPSIVGIVCTWLRNAGIDVRGFDSASMLLDHVAQAGLPDAPTLLITDFVMPDMDGIALVQALRARGFDGPCALMSAEIDVGHAVAAMRSGFFHVLEKPLQEAVLLAELDAAMAGFRDRHARRGRQRALAATLTPREREVLEAIAIGKMNKQIADEMGVSIKTVETHRTRVMDKLGLRNLAEVIRCGLELRAGNEA